MATVEIVAQRRPSTLSSNLSGQGRPLPLDETHFAEIDASMLYIEEARARAERAVKTLRGEGAEPHLIRALEDAQQQLSDVAREFRQGTLVAVPAGQTTL